MSWVAEAKASSAKTTRVGSRKEGRGTATATPARATAMSSCVTTTHDRLADRRSTTGLHSGFTAHGR